MLDLSNLLITITIPPEIIRYVIGCSKNVVVRVVRSGGNSVLFTRGISLSVTKTGSVCIN